MLISRDTYLREMQCMTHPECVLCIFHKTCKKLLCLEIQFWQCPAVPCPDMPCMIWIGLCCTCAWHVLVGCAKIPFFCSNMPSFVYQMLSSPCFKPQSLQKVLKSFKLGSVFLCMAALKQRSTCQKFCIKLYFLDVIAVLAEVQRRSAAVLRSGADAIIQAGTGSGKTLAYLLPLLARLSYPPETYPDDLRARTSIPYTVNMDTRLLMSPVHAWTRAGYNI